VESKSVEIRCPSCGQDCLLLRAPLYEGLRRVGEKLSCASCGHLFEDEAAVPFKERRAVRVFTEADKPEAVRVFEGEQPAFCRHCRHYVVNPFTQWCGAHRREVEATETCPSFEPCPPEEAASEAPGPGPLG